MKRQIIKGSTMLILVATLGFAAAVVSANGQSTLKVRAHVPFEFVVGNKSLPAGDYAVSTLTSGTIMAIQNAKTSDSCFRLANAIESNGKRTGARLVFHRYGQNYFLAEVWPGGDETGRKLNESKKERTIKRELKSLARNSYEVVEIVATLQ